MLEFLIDRYGQRNQSNRLFYELSKLKQGPKDSFSTYYTKFQKYRARVHLTLESEIQLLEELLNYRYANKLSDNDYVTVTEIVKKLYKIEDKFARLELYKDKDKPTLDTNRSSNNNGRGGSANRSRRGFTGSTSVGGAGVANLLGLLLYTDLLEKYRVLRPLSKEERQKLIRNSDCLRCREHRYYLRDPTCIFRKYQMLLRANATNVTTLAPARLRDPQGNSETSA